MFRRIAVALMGTLIAFTSAAARAEGPAKSDASSNASKSSTVVPVFRLDGAITERPAGEELPIFDQPGVSLKDLIERMKKAAKDQGVKAVVVVAEHPEFGPGQVEELRQAIDAIEKAGKDVYVHADSATMGTYLLYCSATRLSMSPTADLWLGGIHAETPYLRGLLDKIGIEPDFMTCGEYKSAAEMFMRTGPSKPADEMMNWLLDGIYGSWVKQIAESRKMDEKQVREKLDVGLYSAEKAKAAGLIDAVEHRQDFEAMLKQKFGADLTFNRKYGKPADKQFDMSSPMAVFKIWAELLAGSKEKKPTGPSVAIVYVDGLIIPGSAKPSPFGGGGGIAFSSDVRRALDKALEDDNVKAVVLRIDSQGGSAVASEIILDATKRVAAKKPFVVSMGNIAGSGGYYVACGADTIFADETTITGSIGVVAGKFVTNPMWDKLGITFHEYNRGKNAGLLATSKKFDDEQRTQLKSWMDEVYGTFKQHVTEARGNRLKKPLDDIAGGRVYTGRQALDLGLVDQIGTMDDAIKFIATKANLAEGYAVRVIPEPKNFIEMLVEGMSGEKSADDTKHVFAGSPRMKLSLPRNGSGSITALALPYLQQVDPSRVDVIRSSLQRLDVLQNEGVLLAMPEITIGQ
jgi:protease-4